MSRTAAEDGVVPEVGCLRQEHEHWWVDELLRAVGGALRVGVVVVAAPQGSPCWHAAARSASPSSPAAVRSWGSTRGTWASAAAPAFPASSERARTRARVRGAADSLGTMEAKDPGRTERMTESPSSAFWLLLPCTSRPAISAGTTDSTTFAPPPWNSDARAPPAASLRHSEDQDGCMSLQGHTRLI